MELQSFDIEFTKDGKVFDPGQLDALRAAAGGLTDLFVVSHGWNNDMNEARTLYDELFGKMRALVDGHVVTLPAGRRFGVLRLFWPSKKFADEELIPGGGAASAHRENDAALNALLDELANVPRKLGEKHVDAAIAALVKKAKSLQPALALGEAEAKRAFVAALREIATKVAGKKHSPHLVDDGSVDFFSLDALELFDALDDAVHVPPSAQGKGHAATSAQASGGAAGLKDLVKGPLAAARRIANFVTYYTMKERAGIVGKTGLAPVLMSLRKLNANLKLHLVGHSFGGRLVTAAAHSLPDRTGSVSLSLLQAAFSHNALSHDFDGKGTAGAFRNILATSRASGPVIITHTKNDKAVGIAYPLASRIARQKAAAIGDKDDPYGGMGRNGAQHTDEATDGTLLPVKAPSSTPAYAFAEGRVFNLEGSAFIADHGSVRGQEVALAVWHCALTVR